MSTTPAPQPCDARRFDPRGNSATPNTRGYTMSTVQQEIDNLTRPKPEHTVELEILRELPPDFKAPGLSSVKDKPDGHDGTNAWASFHAPSYDPGNTWNPAAVFETLEAAGWELQPATLAQRDNYRPGPECGLLDSLRQERPSGWGRYQLTDAWPIAPVWVTPCQHTGPDANAFMRTRGGRLLRVSVDLPRVVTVSADRVEPRGTWYYKRGTGRMHHPQHWHAINLPSGTTIAQKAARSHVTVDTEQGISAAIYWEPCGEQDAWSLKASEFVALLLAQ